jgi:hypothetical protein
MEKIFSIHIPKTAGTFFGQVLQSIQPEIIFFNYGPGSSATRIYIHNRLVEPPVGKSHQTFFFDYLKRKDKGVAIMHGHVWERRFYDENPNAKLLCWLREPVQRLYSHYEFFKRQPHPGNERYEKFKRKKQTFVDFATDQLNVNRQTAILDGISMDELFFVGIVEKVNQSLNLFQNVLKKDFSVKETFSLNKNENRNSESYKISNEDFINIKERNLLDYRHYDEIVRAYQKNEKSI